MAHLMEQRISVITLAVGDLGAARKFYEQGLGWKASAASNEGIVFFQMNGFVFSLYPRADFAAETGRRSPEAGADGIALAHNTRAKEQVDELLAAAVEAGGKLLKAAEEAVWGGYSGYFADLDGHSWEVAWNPHWPIAPDGTIHLPE